MLKRKILFLVFCLFTTYHLSLTTVLYASFPEKVNLQGFLTSSNGEFLTGVHNVTFRIFGGDNGGAVQLWTEVQSNVSVNKGVFQVVLGNVVSFPQNLFSGTQDLWLEIQVDNDSPMVPRQKFVSVPYSIMSETVVDNSITTAKIQDTSITGNKIQAGTITDTNISATAEISDSKLSGTGNVVINFNADKLDGNHANYFIDTSATGQSKSGGLNISGNIGIGTNNPLHKLVVTGGDGVSDLNGTQVMQNGQVEINGGGTGNRLAYIDFHGDDTYTDFSLRMIRANTGANAVSQILHRGTGELQVETVEGGNISFWTNSAERAIITAGGATQIVNGNSIQVLDAGNVKWGRIIESGNNNGNLHIDEFGGGGTYINWFGGSPVVIGNGDGTNYGDLYARNVRGSWGGTGYGTGMGGAMLCNNGGNSFHVDWVWPFLNFYIDKTLVKTFIIQHPANPDKYLIHATLEGPENAVFYRGVGKLVNGEVKVELPTYFESLTSEENRTVQLTNVDGYDKLNVITINDKLISNGKFIVKSDNDKSTQKFTWEVKAVRKDVKPLLIEPDKTQVNVYGDGPYKYYSIR